jgi:hypothetical protein
MIYQLRDYIAANFPTEIIYANTVKPISPNTDVPIRYAVLTENPGNSQPITDWCNHGLQIITRDVDSPKARELSYAIRDYINNKFSLTLPATTVDGVNFPSVILRQISANALPGFIGENENGYAEWSTNYRILFTEV